MHYKLKLHTISSNLYTQQGILQQNIKLLTDLKCNKRYQPLDAFTALRIADDLKEQYNILRHINSRITEAENEAFRYGL